MTNTILEFIFSQFWAAGKVVLIAIPVILLFGCIFLVIRKAYLHNFVPWINPRSLNEVEKTKEKTVDPTLDFFDQTHPANIFRNRFDN